MAEQERGSLPLQAADAANALPNFTTIASACFRADWGASLGNATLSIGHYAVPNEVASTTNLGDLFAGIARLIENVRKRLEENNDVVVDLLRSAHRNFIFDKAGWLVHHTTPLHLITDDMTAESISATLEAYYRNNWADVASAFRTRLNAMDVDDEVRATFNEALEAHGSGLYRCAVRVLFPEIERFARQQLHNAPLKSFASLTQVRRATGELGWTDLTEAVDGPIFLQLGAMFHHLYEKVETPDRLSEIAKSPIPNRHAALHGFVVYDTLQSSLAALIMAEFIFKMISYLKSRQVP